MTLKSGRGGPRKGAGRPTQQNPLRSRNIRFTDDEWQQVQQRAKAAGLTTSEYIRRKLLQN